MYKEQKRAEIPIHKKNRIKKESKEAHQRGLGNYTNNKENKSRTQRGSI